MSKHFHHFSPVSPPIGKTIEATHISPLSFRERVGVRASGVTFTVRKRCSPLARRDLAVQNSRMNLSASPLTLFRSLLCVNLAVWMFAEVNGEWAFPWVVPVLALAASQAALAGLWLTLGDGSAWKRLSLVAILIAIWGVVFQYRLAAANPLESSFLKEVWIGYSLRFAEKVSQDLSAVPIAFGLALTSTCSAGLGIAWRTFGWKISVSTPSTLNSSGPDDETAVSPASQLRWSQFSVANLLQLTTVVAVLSSLGASINPAILGLLLFGPALAVAGWTSLLAWGIFVTEFRKEKIGVVLALIACPIFTLLYVMRSEPSQWALVGFVLLEVLATLVILAGLRRAGFQFAGVAGSTKRPATWTANLRMRWNRVSGKVEPVNIPNPNQREVPLYEPRGLSPGHVRQFIPALIAVSFMLDAFLWLNVRGRDVALWQFVTLLMLLASQIGVVALWLGLSRHLSITKITIVFLIIELVSFLIAIPLGSEMNGEILILFSIVTLADFLFVLIARNYGVCWTYKPPDASYQQFPVRGRFQFSLKQMFLWTTIAALFSAGLRLFIVRDFVGLLSWNFLGWLSATTIPAIICPWLIFGKSRAMLRWVVALATYSLATFLLWHLSFPTDVWISAWFVFVNFGWSLFSLATIRTTGYRLRRTSPTK